MTTRTVPRPSATGVSSVLRISENWGNSTPTVPLSTPNAPTTIAVHPTPRMTPVRRSLPGQATGVCARPQQCRPPDQQHQDWGIEHADALGHVVRRAESYCVGIDPEVGQVLAGGHESEVDAHRRDDRGRRDEHADDADPAVDHLLCRRAALVTHRQVQGRVRAASVPARW